MANRTQEEKNKKEPEPHFLKTKMCKFHTQGLCTRGASCGYAHRKAEMKPLPDFHRTRLCPSLKRNGCCDKGEGCNFAHNKDEIRKLPKGKRKQVPMAREACTIGLNLESQEEMRNCEQMQPASPPLPWKLLHAGPSKSKWCSPFEEAWEHPTGEYEGLGIQASGKFINYLGNSCDDFVESSKGGAAFWQNGQAFDGTGSVYEFRMHEKAMCSL